MFILNFFFFDQVHISFSVMSLFVHLLPYNNSGIKASYDLKGL